MTEQSNMDNKDTLYTCPMAKELVYTLGLPLASRFIESFKGQCIYIPKKLKKSYTLLHKPPLTNIDILKIFKAFNGQYLTIPKTLLTPKTTKPEILKLAKENIKSMGKPNINIIAKKTNTTHRWVQIVLAQARLDDKHLNSLKY